ncbi:MAG: SDR family oxidoreductase [Ruminococcus sp.]|nr:SDR family oxidoreductase [Ruminococcus sp.]MCI5599322.1 SDR family oxidoreductase [Ruminococcus sp.]
MAKTMIVTSATSGIGKAIAKKLLKESTDKNDKLIINYFDKNQMEEMSNELSEADKEKVTFIYADMSTYEGMEGFVNDVLKVSDKIDWLVCNTAIGTYKKFEEYDYELWDTILRTNLSVPTFMVQKFKPHFNDGGKIIFMGSLCGKLSYSSSLVYSVSKAGVHHLAKCLLKEFDGQNVSINAIAPSFVETPWQKGRSKESYDRINRKINLHRFAQPDEVAKLVYDTMTNDFINGTLLEISGGYEYF